MAASQAEPEPVAGATDRSTIRPETKHRYLEAGAELARSELVTEPAFAHVASHVKLTTVADRLGVSRSSLYRRWPTQHDFWRDLVVFMSTRDDEPWMYDDLDRQALRPGRLDDLLDRIRTEFDRAQARLAKDPRMVLRAALLGYPPDPEIAESRAEWEAAERRDAARRLDLVLEAARRAPVAPLTTLDLATAIWLMADGVAMAAAADPSFATRRLHVDGDATRPWTLLAYAVRCIVLELTTEVDEAPAGERSSVDAVPGRPPGRAVARWDADQRRALEVGAELFARSIQQPTSSDGSAVEALGHVTLARVARASGVTRRQLYHLWDSQESFRRELVRHITSEEGATYYASFDEGIAEVMRAPRLSHVALDICEHINQWRLDTDAEVQPSVGSALVTYMGDEDVRAGTLRWMSRLRDFQQGRIDAFVQLFGARLRPGVESSDVNSLFMMAAGGSERLHRVDPTAMRAGIAYRGGAYTIFSIACQAFVDHTVVSSS